MAVFALVSAITAAFGDVVSLLLALGLGAAAFNELRAGSMLKRFDPRGARYLCYNQLAVGALILTYSGWSLYSTLRDPALTSLPSTGDAEMDALMSDITGKVTWGLYASMAVVGTLVPGLTAWYYYSRAALVRTLVAQTPPWVLQTLRAAG